MPEFTPIALVPGPVDLDSKEFGEIRGWPFVGPFVGRLLLDDIPRRVLFGWVGSGPIVTHTVVSWGSARSICAENIPTCRRAGSTPTSRS